MHSGVQHRCIKCISVSAGLNDNRTVESSDQQNGPQRNHLITAPNPGTNGVARIIVKSFPTSEPKGLIELRRSPFLALNFHYIDPLIATLKPQSNGPSYSNTVIGTLAVDWEPTHQRPVYPLRIIRCTTLPLESKWLNNGYGIVCAS